MNAKFAKDKEADPTQSLGEVSCYGTARMHPAFLTTPPERPKQVYTKNKHTSPKFQAE